MLKLSKGVVIDCISLLRYRFFQVLSAVITCLWPSTYSLNYCGPFYYKISFVELMCVEIFSLLTQRFISALSGKNHKSAFTLHRSIH